MPTARELVERAQARDAKAFSELVRIYQRMSLSVAFNVLQDASAAGDVAQDAFIRAWERLADLRDTQRFATWLCGIVRNLAIDRLRRQRRNQPIGSGTPREDRWTRDPVDDACRRESSSMVEGAIDALDEVAKAAVKMRYYDQLPSKQIAQVLGISADAVDMRLIRARKRLRAALSHVAQPPSAVFRTKAQVV